MSNYNIILEYIGVFVFSFLFVYALTPLIIKLALKINFVDNPNARKIHKKAIPLMGGLSVFTGFSILLIYDVIIVANRLFDVRLTGYLLGALVIVIVGLIDDKFGMKPKTKMLGQFVACGLFIASNFGVIKWIAPAFLNGMEIPIVTFPTEIMFNNYFSIPILFIWMIGLMNATNFLDNMDGMISGISAILGLGFFAFSIIISPSNANSAMWLGLMGLISLSYSGSLLGFLFHNFNPAKIFLGDAGSMFIGYFLSSMGILMANFASIEFNSKWFYLLPVVLISYAIFDICFVSITRKKDGRYILQGGKDHTTHRMKNVLQSVKITACMAYIINLIAVILTILITISGKTQVLLFTFGICLISYIIFAVKLYSVEVEIPANQIKKK